MRNLVSYTFTFGGRELYSVQHLDVLKEGQDYLDFIYYN
jgi:hypothetical protein